MSMRNKRRKLRCHRCKVVEIITQQLGEEVVRVRVVVVVVVVQLEEQQEKEEEGSAAEEAVVLLGRRIGIENA